MITNEKDELWLHRRLSTSLQRLRNQHQLQCTLVEPLNGRRLDEPAKYSSAVEGAWDDQYSFEGR